MKCSVLLSFIGFNLLSSICLSQQIVPAVVAGVDTSQTEVKEVYHLYKNYLNSHPDSAYNNPYWVKDEKPILDSTFKRPADRFYFANYWIKFSSKYYKFTILGITKVYNSNAYRIRTLIDYTDDKYIHWNGLLYNPPFITLYYAEKTSDGWKLENAMAVETNNWKHYDTKYIHYIYPPEFNFNKPLADKADSFCTALTDTFGIKEVQPFTYYINIDIEQMGRLFNMEYWGFPTYGYTIFATRQIISARATEYHIHEFVHMLLPRSKNNMIGEGIATYFAGPGDETFKQALTAFSKEIKNNDTITFDDIYTQKYHHSLDSKPFYVTGAVVCKFVYDKKGIEGLKELLKCPSNKEEDFDKTVLALLGIDKKTFEKEVINYIKGYTK